MSEALDDQVRSLLVQRKGDWQQVAEGSGVSYSWLSKFVNRHIDNPGYATLTRLHAYLTQPARRRDDTAPPEQGTRAVHPPMPDEAPVMREHVERAPERRSRLFKPRAVTTADDAVERRTNADRRREWR